MKRLFAILVLLPALISAQAAPVVIAHWLTPRTAEIAWSVPGVLYRHGADGIEIPIGRFEAAGALELSGPDDAYTPQEGDLFVLKDLIEDRVLASAVLGPRPLPRHGVALPLIAKQTWYQRLVLVVRP